MNEQRHILRVWDGNFNIMHPLSCRPKPFDCVIGREVVELLNKSIVISDGMQQGRYWIESSGDESTRIGAALSEQDELVVVQRVAVEAAAFQLSRVLDYMVSQKTGGLSIGYAETSRDGTPKWTVGFEFGAEADDSPMAGGAAYGVEDTLEQSIAAVIKTCGLDERGF